MSISFIVTTLNNAADIRQCLDSIRQCAQPGDELLLVDQGSTDETLATSQSLLDDGQWPSGVARRMMEKAAPSAGRAVAVNQALDQASGDFILLLSGAEYLIPAGFGALRQLAESGNADVSIGKYLEHEQLAGLYRKPFEDPSWQTDPGADPVRQRLWASTLISSFCRVLVRRQLLAGLSIRFREDNPAWADTAFFFDICASARVFRFSNEIVSHRHALIRGQGARGVVERLRRLFAHYPWYAAQAGAEQAALYLAGQLCTLLPAEPPSAYAWSCEQTGTLLAGVPDAVWQQQLRPAFSMHPSWPCLEKLRLGDTWSVLEAWKARDRAARFDHLNTTLGQLQSDVHALLKHAHAQQKLNVSRILESRDATDQRDTLLSQLQAAQDELERCYQTIRAEETNPYRFGSPDHREEDSSWYLGGP